ncbi:TIGR04283 family arsenosugar biosynthesis glycosyltransferase [Methylophaga sp. OBS4]|uniref:TIGR04283 family arsenosugar biosynthesis glycosyltransferase n=1 Tax=Methylophaga sp. OBS4 TaxID=2991935 RepID=UPI00225502BB|nr:TIGR04283 family arsenosugar biosynthesis glycosyltransferase [Methylophaga sp. OBS4]MCX4186522.1 TIGR04283 family arsenosugar biosynthesis glycosyltransferase [Methylophaga sp. OBS4]
MKPQLAIIVPMLNEAGTLPELLAHLQRFHDRGMEIVLVDGGSDDATRDIASQSPFTVITSTRGRALQMNTGAQASDAGVLLFLHADTRLPDTADIAIGRALAAGRQWGRFNVKIEARHPVLKIVAMMMNLRSRLSGIVTGDQALFMTREVFNKVGGFPRQPLMEDIEISKRLKGLGLPACLWDQVTTSGRRWQKFGVWRTIWLMWQLRFDYWRGVPASKLAGRYQ